MQRIPVSASTKSFIGRMGFCCITTVSRVAHLLSSQLPVWLATLTLSVQAIVWEQHYGYSGTFWGEIISSTQLPVSANTDFFSFFFSFFFLFSDNFLLTVTCFCQLNFFCFVFGDNFVLTVTRLCQHWPFQCKTAMYCVRIAMRVSVCGDQFILTFTCSAGR